jgi:hypothetical protein
MSTEANVHDMGPKTAILLSRAFNVISKTSCVYAAMGFNNLPRQHTKVHPSSPYFASKEHAVQLTADYQAVPFSLSNVLLAFFPAPPIAVDVACKFDEDYSTTAANQDFE